MNEEQARLQLAEDLMNLAEAIKDPDISAGRVDELFGSKRELHIESVFGGSTTLIAIKRWTEEELDRIKEEAEELDSWPDIIEG